MHMGILVISLGNERNHLGKEQNSFSINMLFKKGWIYPVTINLPATFLMNQKSPNNKPKLNKWN